MSIKSITKPPKKTVGPKISRTSNASKLLDEKHIGSEIIDMSLVSAENMRQTIRENLHHYNYFYDNKDAVKWVSAWMKKHKTATEQKQFAAAEDHWVSTAIGGMCKMHMAGAQFDKDQLAWINSKVQELINIGKENLSQKSKEKSTAVAYTKTAADIVKTKAHDFISEVELMIDLYHDKTVYLDAENYSVYNELGKIGATKPIANQVYEKYKPLRDEIHELVTKKTEDLVEAYKGHMPKLADQKKYLAFLDNILSDCEKFVNAKTATTTRKPRAKKKIPVEKVVAKAKYQKDSAEYKLVSVDPVNIVGAKEVYLFNTKYRQISVVVAESDTGLSVRGSGIVGFDESLTLKKTLRKPEEQLPSFNSGTKARMAKVFEQLKTKSAPANARLNEDTIIMKVFK